MIGGFSFKGIHSSVYGIRETPQSAVLSPLKRRNIITIPGRSGGIVQEDGGYDPRVESILCTYAAEDGVDIYQQIRDIAGWLNGIGELTFDREPTLHYNAYLSSPPPTVTMLEFSQFTLEFTYVHPFAYETAQLQSESVGGVAPDNQVSIQADGTISTPVKLIITNNTDKVITEVKIYHKYIEEQ